MNELVTKVDELEKEHEAFIGRPCQLSEVSFKATDLERIVNTSSRNVLGRIQGKFSFSAVFNFASCV